MNRKCNDFLADYLTFAQNTESPISYHTWSCLSIIASVVRRQVWINMGHFKIYPNMYVVLVGPAGRCRKGGALGIATDLIADLTDVKVSADAVTREALIRAISQSKMDIEMDGEIYQHSSFTIISKELSVFLGIGNTDLLSLLTDLYDNPNHWEYRTKGSGIDTINNLWLNMLAASTPDWLVGSVPMGAIGGGFTSRVLFIVEYDQAKRVAIPFVTAEELLIKENLKHDLEQMTSICGEFNFSPDARDFFVAWYEDENRSQIEDPRFRGYEERKHVHLLKVALILAISENSDHVIEQRYIQRAIDLLGNIEGNMVDAFGGCGKSDIAGDLDLILDILKMYDRISKRDITHLTWRDVSPGNFDAVIQTLITMGLLRITSEGSEIIYEFQKDTPK